LSRLSAQVLLAGAQTARYAATSRETFRLIRAYVL
jgi:hypothetical protein